jgi:hypothetical protein
MVGRVSPPRAFLLTLLLAAALMAGACAAPPGALASWGWPVDGEFVAPFRYAARDPFAAGQRRGIAIAAPPGAVVRSACRGRVSFAGPVPGGERAVTVRCGALAATHLGLARLAVTAGTRVGAGTRLGVLGPGGRLRLGARATGRRFAYVDPLALLRVGRPHGGPDVPLGRAPRGPAVAPRVVPPPPVPSPPAPAPAAAPRRPAPPPVAWAGLVVVAAGLPLGGVVARSRRRRAVTAARAAPESR